MLMTNQTAHPVQTATEFLINRHRATVAWKTTTESGTEYGLAFNFSAARERFISGVNRSEAIAAADWTRYGDAGLVFTLPA